MMKRSIETLGEQVGVKGGFVFLRGVWNDARKEYESTQSRDGELWEPWDDSANTFSIRYHGGPKDGTTEW